MDVYKFIPLLISTASLAFGATVYFLNCSRERKKNTIEYWNKFYSSEYKNILSFLKNYPELREGNFDRIITSYTGLEQLHHILNSFEKLSIGVNLNIYDAKALHRMAGGSIISLFEMFMPYIRHRQQNSSQCNSWSEFEILFNKLKSIRNKSSSLLYSIQ